MDWSVNVETASLDGSPAVASCFDRLLIVLSAFGARGQSDQSGWSLSLIVNAESAIDALVVVQSLLRRSGTKVGLPDWQIVHVDATSD